MPVIRISDATFTDLSVLKTWLGGKTPSETIDRLVRDEMERLGIERDHGSTEASPNDAPAIFDEAPGLSFTKPLAATLNGQAIARPNWTTILISMIGLVKAKGLHGEQLARALSIPAKAERFEADGFKYHPELGLSVQGQSAADCWKETERLAHKWRIPITVEFQWRDNPKAQHPGKIGKLRSGGA